MDNRAKSENVILNCDYSLGKSGDLPEGWELKTPYGFLRPVFRLTRKERATMLLATGGGNPDCLGWLTTSVRVTGGTTYRLRARFKVSKGTDPQANLLFAFYTKDGFNDGIFHFTRLADGWVEGEGRFAVPGEGENEGDVRIYFRYSSHGKAWISSVTLDECEPIAPRPVKVAATHGKGDLEAWAKMLDAVGASGADLVLLPETFNGLTPEPIDGPSASLMSNYAKLHKMYVAGSFLYRNSEPERIYNAGVLYDRDGKLVGKYYKNHPYSPEAFLGVTPGVETPVFKTDFGKVAMIICYDSWFTDVTELLALKGAEIILFPSAGYCRGLLPARSADNCVRFVASSENIKPGIWDTAGGDITCPGADSSRSPNCEGTFYDVTSQEIGDLEMLTATLDLSKSPSPHNWGGPMLSAPGGRRNRREQKRLLCDDIKREIMRWWDDD